jgi:hypothetical protein
MQARLSVLRYISQSGGDHLCRDHEAKDYETKIVVSNQVQMQSSSFMFSLVCLNAGFSGIYGAICSSMGQPQGSLRREGPPEGKDNAAFRCKQA